MLGTGETVHDAAHRLRDWILLAGDHQQLRSEMLGHPRIE